MMAMSKKSKSHMNAAIAVALTALLMAAIIPLGRSHVGSGSGALAVIEAKTIDRNDDPVIVLGSQIPSYQGYANTNIFVWAFRGGAWQQVVFQIDEANGMWPFDNVHKRYGSDNNPGVFDSDDEICFMTSETGDRVDVGTWAPGADLDKPRLEITAHDPLTSNKGWAYIFHHSTPPTWTTTSYVSWTESTNSLAATNYTMDYPDDDTRNSYFHDLRVTPAGGGTNGQFIDRQKFYSQWRYLFITNRICEQTWATQWSGTDDDGHTSENSLTVGPVRIIRHWRMCYNPGGSTEWGEKKSFQVFYYRSHVHTLEHGKFWGSTTHHDDRNSIDHVLTSPAAQYWDSNGNTCTIDGTTTGDSFGNTAPLDWYQVSSPHGSYVKTADLTITTSPTITSDWIDNSGANDNDGGRTGASAGKFGDVSMHRMQSLSSATLWNIDYHLFLMPANSEEQGADHFGRAGNPVSTTDFPPASQDYVPSDTEPPATVPGSVLVEGLATYSTTLSAAGTVMLTATVDDTGLGDSAIAGAVWTQGLASFPGTAMAASDGAFDQVAENVQASIDISGWGVGNYEIYAYGTDSHSNQNITSAEHATIIITDDLPPETLGVLADGMPEYVVPLSEAFHVTITAVISDADTGGSLIGGANLSVGAANWPGTGMNPDTALDSDTESFSLALDISDWLPGTYLVHVYGWDQIPNCNMTSDAYATIIITDDAAPEIRDVLVDGQPSITVYLSSLPTVTLTGVVDDTGHGDNVIAGANYTIGIAAWPGIPMAPDDALDSPVEGFSAGIDLAGWTPGTYDFYMYGWDEMNDCNISSNAYATVIIVDDIPPWVLGGTVNGLETCEVMLSEAATVNLACVIDDTNTGGSIATGANFTLGPGNWPGTAMAPDGALNSPVEGFHHSLDISAWAAGTYILYFYGWDASPAHNATSVETAMIVIHDDFAPEILDVRINGTAEFTVSFVNATAIELTALVDDTGHGSTAIGGANWTNGIANWPGAPMQAADGTFDEVAEDVISIVDISAWTPGTYLLYVYAWDATPIYNASSMAFAKLTIVDDVAPDIEDFLANGAKELTVLLTDPPVTVSGWVNDTLRGGSLAAFGTYALDMDNSTLAPMEAVGTIDSPAEQFTGTIAQTDHRAGTHTFYMYGADSMNNFNDTSEEHVSLTIVDNLAPSTGWTVKVNGQYTLSLGEADDKTIWVNATASDAMRGYLNITGANCTVGFANWPGLPMAPRDGAFDNHTEDVTLQYDVSAWPVGTYRFYAYGTDEAGNGNVTAAEYATLNIEGLGPAIEGPWAGPTVNEATHSPYMWETAASFVLKAYGDDRARGNSIVVGAEYFVDAIGANGTGIPMSNVGYRFDSPYEGAKATIDCSGWSEGEHHTYYVHFQDATGFWGDWGSVTVIKRADHPIPIHAGWNLISLPLVTPSSHIEDILAGISWDRAFIYDCAERWPWLSHHNGGIPEINGFDTVTPAMGIWVHATAPGTLVISGGTPSPTIELRAGWNLVGYPTLTEGVSASDALAGTGADMIAVYDGASPSYIRDVTDLSTVTMEPGQGYWIHVPADTVWTINW